MYILAQRLIRLETEADRKEFLCGVAGLDNDGGKKKFLAGIISGALLAKATKK